MEAIGQLDELNASLGLARLHSSGTDTDDDLAEIQSQLFDFGSELAAPANSRFAREAVTDVYVAFLERGIDAMTADLPPLTNFILPGGTALAAHLHFSRTVCRRAERVLQALDDTEGVRPEAKRYLNRLSDWLFTAARTANASQNVEDVPWRRPDPEKP
jgi:cob(I)alamin adenosyltransferase